MPNPSAITTPTARLFGDGQNEHLPRLAALAAAIAAIALTLALAAWHPTITHADGGSPPARAQTATHAPTDSAPAIRARSLQILRALIAHDANNWTRYWQARHACAAPATRRDAANHTPLDNALIALTAAICPRLDARLGVNPADHPPRGDDQTGGLLLNEPGAAIGYTLFTLWGEGNRKIYLIDPLGRTAHTWRLDETQPGDGILHAKLLDNGNLLLMAGPMLEIDPRGNIVWQYAAARVHHDFLKMPNGNVLLLCVARKSREQAIAAGANPAFVPENGLNYDYLLEVRPTSPNNGEIVWQWSPWEHLVQDFDPTKPNYGAIADHPELIDLNFLLETLSLHRQHAPSDWLHANAIDYNHALDQVMLSPRHYSELWIIDHSPTTQEARGHSGGNSNMGGDLLYRWGNPRAYQHGDASDQRLFWQHTTHWIPPGLPGAGNILAFSNGKEFHGNERGYSSVDEIAPPVDGYRYRRADNAPYPPDKPAWTYAAEPPTDFYAPFTSGAQRLPNGSALIADGPAGTIFQATHDGKIVWKYIVPNHYHISQWQNDGAPPWLAYGLPDIPAPAVKNDIYRAYWYPPDHPGLQALDLAPGAYLQNDTNPFDWTRAAILDGDFGEPIAQSRYDVYLDENALIYYKQPCAPEDTQARFFLHIYPADETDLPVRRQKIAAARQERGFDNSHNFWFPDAGKISHDSCIAIASLPSYPIHSIHTGQFAQAGQQWRAEITLNE